MQLIKFVLISILCFTLQTIQSADSLSDNSYELSYFFPSSQPITLEQARSSDDWQPSADGWIRENQFQTHFWLGDTPRVAWLKLDFNKEIILDDERWIELASSGVTRASLYKYKNGNWQVINSDESQKGIRTDDVNQIGNAPIRTRFISFLVTPQDINDSIYIRAEATDKLHLQLNIKSNQDFIIDSSISNFIYAMGYGILLVMILYNLFIGYTLQDRLYYIYSGAISSTLFYQFFAHGHARLFGHFNWDHVNYSLNILVIMIVTLSLYFMYYFCNIKIYTPKIARPLRLYMKFMVLITLLSVVMPTSWSLNLILTIVGTTPLFALVIASYAWYKGSPTASIFILSWLAYIIGGFLWQVYWLGLVTLNEWVEIPLIAGAALESILLSLALAYRIRVLNEQTTELKISNAHYRKISEIDQLSKLANRRAFDAKMKAMKSSSRDFGLILFDIDHFKKFNDKYGHPAGDKVIKSLAEVLKKNMRNGDLAARIGGEEFATIIKTSDVDVLMSIANRIRSQFSQIPFSVYDEKVYCSVSAGVASSPEVHTIRQLIDTADKALYQAKDSGRNTVV